MLRQMMLSAKLEFSRIAVAAVNTTNIEGAANGTAANFISAPPFLALSFFTPPSIPLRRPLPLGAEPPSVCAGGVSRSSASQFTAFSLQALGDTLAVLSTHQQRPSLLLAVGRGVARYHCCSVMMRIKEMACPSFGRGLGQRNCCFTINFHIHSLTHSLLPLGSR